MLYLGGDDPELLKTVANKIVDEMRRLKELRAPRVGADLRRPEITSSRASTWPRTSA